MKDFLETLGIIIYAVLMCIIATVAFSAIVFIFFTLILGVPVGAIALIVKLILLIF